MNILITAGGTKEFIDGVRYIGNSSTGSTGSKLADYLSGAEHQVTWLGAQSALRPRAKNVNQISYETFDELALQLERLLANETFDVVFHAAAVSDFKVASVLIDGESFSAGRDVKLPTSAHVQLNLSQQPKLVSSLKQWSKNPALKVVAFKLTNSKDTQVQQVAINKLLNQQTVNWVAHNDLHDISSSEHSFNLYGETGFVTSCKDILTLSDQVISFHTKQQESCP